VSERLPSVIEGLEAACGAADSFEIWRPEAHHRHLAVRWRRGADPLLVTTLAEWALVTAVATDERHLEESCFKVYRVFSPRERGSGSAPEPFLVLEQMIEEGDREGYLDEMAAAIDREGREDHLPFQREIAESLRGECRSWPEPPYPKRMELDGRTLGSRIVVGPVHAGVIEPGRFTFALVGEEIQGVRIDLGYKRKGIEKLFEGRAPGDGVELAGSVSGDSSVAHELAYCLAVESLADVSPVPRDQTLRAILLELERVANHVNDVGALARDVAFDWPATQIFVLRERLRVLSEEWAASRLLRRTMRLGGLRSEVAEKLAEGWSGGALPGALEEVLTEFREVARILWENVTVRGRMEGLAPLSREDARRFAVSGILARSSGLARDDRLDHPWGPYADYPHDLHHRFYDHDYVGDVLSRLAIRLDEIEASRVLLGWLAERLVGQLEGDSVTDEKVASGLREAEPYTYRIGSCEGWRGDVVYWLMKDAEDRLFRVKVRDPSRVGWPALEHVLSTGEVALGDFPLINKSFNLSYAGNDL